MLLNYGETLDVLVSGILVVGMIVAIGDVGCEVLLTVIVVTKVLVLEF